MLEKYVKMAKRNPDLHLEGCRGRHIITIAQ